MFLQAIERLKQILESYCQTCAEGVFLVEFSGEEDSVFNMLIAEPQRHLIGDVIGRSKCYAALIVGSNLTQFVAHVRRLVSFQIVRHDLIGEPDRQLPGWYAQEDDPGSVAAEIEDTTV